MPFTSTNTFRLTTFQHIDIDCSAVEPTVSLQSEFAPLLGWLQTVPRRSAIHVTLRFATGRPAGRKLKALFQSMGCTVSMKTVF